MNTLERLNHALSRQAHDGIIPAETDALTQRYTAIAAGYAEIENLLVVLSDLRRRVSHVYCGKFASNFSLSFSGDVIDSIWEEEILNLVHPCDLERKYLQELRFHSFISHLPKGQKQNYMLQTHIRLRNKKGVYVLTLHRLFYIPSENGTSQRFALCLYGRPYGGEFVEGAVDCITGHTVALDHNEDSKILSAREREVLKLVSKGESSKTIAESLYISIHTVSRHRQEILRKLQAHNSHEACRKASLLGLL